MEMSYLGVHGNIMTGSGLKEVLELIYGENAVGYIFGCKAIARGLRELFKEDAVLNTLLVSNNSMCNFHFSWNRISPRKMIMKVWVMSLKE